MQQTNVQDVRPSSPLQRAVQQAGVQDVRPSSPLQRVACTLDHPIAQLSFLNNPQSGISVLAAHSECIKCYDEDNTLPMAPAPSAAHSTVASPSNSRNHTPDKIGDRDVSTAIDSVAECPQVSTFRCTTGVEESQPFGEDVARSANWKGGQIVLHPPKAMQAPMSSPAPPAMRLMNAAPGSTVQFGYMRDGQNLASEFDCYRSISPNAQGSRHVPSCESQ